LNDQIDNDLNLSRNVS